MTSQSLALSGIGKRFGGDDVLKGIDLTVQPGEFLSLVGMSGCGKSTLLRIIAGLESPTQGSVSIGGRDVTDVDPSDRNLAMVFQSYALYPHGHLYTSAIT
ncbi:glycerol-3-phosphate ABC transporter ATP-binding protein, partial [Aureimonas ureilytica]